MGGTDLRWITQARARLGSGPVVEVFGGRRGAGGRCAHARGVARSVAVDGIDGFDWDVPDTAANVAESATPGRGATARCSKARVVTISEPRGGGGRDRRMSTGEQSLARDLYPALGPDAQPVKILRSKKPDTVL